jgi:hypothetical protein
MWAISLVRERTPMHERTQRAVSRLLFVFCCAVPTMITMLCVLVTWTPWYHNRALESLESAFSRDTGLIVQIEDFRRIAPSSLDLYQVLVLDPETQQEVARVRKLQWVSNDEEVAIVLHQPELQSSELAGAWQLIHDRFLCRPERTTNRTEVSCNDLTIHSRAGGQTFRDVRAWISPGKDAVDAIIQAVPVDSLANATIDIAVRRDRSGANPTTQWTLDTHDTPLPCSALAEYLPTLENLGTEAMFYGVMRWQLSGQDWWVDLSGSRFEEVSLSRVFERHEHRLTGTANIRLTRCRIEPSNRRSVIAGSIVARNGVIGQMLLSSARRFLNFTVREDVLADANRDPNYDLLALEFDLNSTQLELTGICRNDSLYHGLEPDVVLCLDQMPLAKSSRTTIDALQVASVFAPTHSVPVPISDQTSWLMNVLMPPSRPLPRDEQYPPRIRSVGTAQGGPTVRQPPF